MNYTAEEKDVQGTVLDFIKFCDFIEAEKPLATQKGDLGTKACYEINKLLRYTEKNAKTTDRMYRYASVALWFAVAKEAGFVALDDAKSSKSVYITTEKYADFKKLNTFSQYLLIFYVWFCFVDPEVQYNERGFTSILSELTDMIFAQLATNGSHKWISQSEKESRAYDRHAKPVQVMMAHYYKTARSLKDFNLILFEDSDKLTQYFNLPLIEKLKPTELGVAMTTVCGERKYTWFNVHADKAYIGINWHGDKEDADDDDELYDQTMESIKNGTAKFTDPFVSFFPQGSVDIPGIYRIIFEHDNFGDDTRVFEFKVSLGKKCYRIIRCLPEHTFEDLHIAIQEAFDFDDDHLYSFFLDGKSYSNYRINSPDGGTDYDEPPFTDEIFLSDRRLINKQRILYLFDYSDCWEFDVAVGITKKGAESFKNPVIIKSVGDSPEQYPDYDDY